MTPQLEAAIAAIKPLSLIERQQPINILSHSDLSSSSQTELRMLSSQFWQDTMFEQLLASKTPKTIYSLNDLASDFWSEEDSIDEFLCFLRQQRQEAI